MLTDEDFKRADVEATRTIDILDFVESGECGHTLLREALSARPERGGAKPHALLREALAATGRIGIAKVVIRTRQHLAALKPLDDALVLNLMRFHGELVDLAELDLPSDADVTRVSSRWHSG